MMHVRWQTRYDDAEFRALLARNWSDAALYYYNRHYNVGDEPTDDEIRLMAEWWLSLKESMPETMRTGVHMLRMRAGCMGEDICVVDGGIQHSFHVGHKACKTYSIVSRKGGKRWCVTCSRDVADDEIADDVRP